MKRVVHWLARNWIFLLIAADAIWVILEFFPAARELAFNSIALPFLRLLALFNFLTWGPVSWAVAFGCLATLLLGISKLPGSWEEIKRFLFKPPKRRHQRVIPKPRKVEDKLSHAEKIMLDQQRNRSRRR